MGIQGPSEQLYVSHAFLCFLLVAEAAELLVPFSGLLLYLTSLSVSQSGVEAMLKMPPLGVLDLPSTGEHTRGLLKRPE